MKYPIGLSSHNLSNFFQHPVHVENCIGDILISSSSSQYCSKRRAHSWSKEYPLGAARVQNNDQSLPPHLRFFAQRTAVYTPVLLSASHDFGRVACGLCFQLKIFLCFPSSPDYMTRLNMLHFPEDYHLLGIQWRGLCSSSCKTFETFRVLDYGLLDRTIQLCRRYYLGSQQTLVLLPFLACSWLFITSVDNYYIQLYIYIYIYIYRL